MRVAMNRSMLGSKLRINRRSTDNHHHVHNENNHAGESEPLQPVVSVLVQAVKRVFHPSEEYGMQSCQSISSLSLLHGKPVIRPLPIVQRAHPSPGVGVRILATTKLWLQPVTTIRSHGPEIHPTIRGVSGHDRSYTEHHLILECHRPGQVQLRVIAEIDLPSIHQPLTGPLARVHILVRGKILQIVVRLHVNAVVAIAQGAPCKHCDQSQNGPKIQPRWLTSLHRRHFTCS
mmetsp:Transcript_28576/g.68724  ORF Transcript_28576/g.68724 Transcript_28576/m.68724 type:complete len:232 (-) Transcript_28576:269-964(-)